MTGPTKQEKIVQKELERNGWYVVPQVKFGKITVDLFIPQKNVVIEVDGSHHSWLSGQAVSDTWRDTYLETIYGVRVRRVKNAVTKNKRDFDKNMAGIHHWLQHLPDVIVSKSSLVKKTKKIKIGDGDYDPPKADYTRVIFALILIAFLIFVLPKIVNPCPEEMVRDGAGNCVEKPQDYGGLTSKEAKVLCDSYKIDCVEAETQRNAQFLFEFCKAHGYGDAHNWDSDDNGIACEHLTLTTEPLRVTAPAPICGNGVVEIGENCLTCSNDVKCSLGETCRKEGVCKLLDPMSNDLAKELCNQLVCPEWISSNELYVKIEKQIIPNTGFIDCSCLSIDQTNKNAIGKTKNGRIDFKEGVDNAKRIS